MAGVRLEANFHIITGQVTAIKNIMKCVDQGGLETQELILEPLASSESVLSEEEKEAGIVLVDIGGGTTDVAIFHEGIIRHTAVIPFGGNSVTEDIREGCSVMRNQAELLKVKFGSALAEENKENEIICVPGLRGREPKEISVKNLAFVIQARMEEIIDHVYYEIKSSGYEKKLIGGIVVTGGGALLKHLPQLIEFVTGLDCRVGYPNEHLAKNESLPKNVYEDLKSPMYSTGIGLLIKGIEKVENELQREKTSSKPMEVIIDSSSRKNRGLFASLLEGTKKFIKDDISDQDFLK
jgi:cell division protein FtsA